MDTTEIMKLPPTELRLEAQRRADAKRPGWHNDGNWIGIATIPQLRAYLIEDRAPVFKGETAPAPAPKAPPPLPPKPQPAPEAKPAPAPVIIAPKAETLVQEDAPTGADASLAALRAVFGPVIEPLIRQQKLDVEAMQRTLDEAMEEINKRVNERLDAHKPAEKLVFVRETQPEIRREIGTYHRQFEELVNLLQARKPGKKNVLLYGSAGDGKSFAARQVAEALGMDFHIQPCGQGTQEYHFNGFTMPQVGYMETPMYRAFTSENPNGAVLCIDEIDASDPAVGLILNGITNGQDALFPHPIGGKPRPGNLMVIATANTINGADAKFTARFEMDAALKDRFMIMKWLPDPELENAMYTKFPAWTKYVQACREAVNELKLAYIVGSRKIDTGEDLLVSGKFGKARVEEIALWGDGSLRPEDVRKVKERVKANRNIVWC